MGEIVSIKHFINRRKYMKEYYSVQRQLKRAQLEATDIFIKVQDNPNRNTGTDEELERANDNPICAYALRFPL
jgi:hypothetical protein